MRGCLFILIALYAVGADQVYAQDDGSVNDALPQRYRFEVKVYGASSWLGPINWESVDNLSISVPEHLHNGTDLGLRGGHAIRPRTILFLGLSRAFMEKHPSDGYRRTKLEAGGEGARPVRPLFPGTTGLSSYNTDALEVGVQAPFFSRTRVSPYGEFAMSLLRSTFENSEGDVANFRGLGVLLEGGIRVRAFRLLAVDVSGIIGLRQYRNARVNSESARGRVDGLHRGWRLALAMAL